MLNETKLLIQNFGVWLMVFWGLDLYKLHVGLNSLFSDLSLICATALSVVSIYKLLTNKKK